MKFKKIRKVYRIYFPKKFTSNEIFEHHLNQNRDVVSIKKKNQYYLANLANNLTIKLRDEKHSDYMVFEQVFKLKQYEIILSLIKLNLNSNNSHVIIDAGANVGYTSLYFSNKIDNLKIYAVEPSNENITILKENIVLNNLDKVICFYHNALSHKKGLKFNLNTDFRDAKDWAITTNQHTNGEIQGITIDEIISENNIDYISFLKIDIEGAERFIFNFENNLSFLKITKIIAIEIHDEFEIREDIYKILKTFGFYLFNEGELTIGINKNLVTI